MTLYFFTLFGGVVLGLGLTFVIFDYGLDWIVATVNRCLAWRQRRTRSNVVPFDQHRRFLAAVSMGRER